jgi:signal transduction histidine kinase
MFSKISESLYRTSAWRLAARSTLVFAAGSAGVFLVMYVLVAQSVHQRSDSWLIGEAQVLKQVAETTPRDALYTRVVEEVAEAATLEVAYDEKGHHSAQNIVFFAQRAPGGGYPLWVGPQESAGFLQALNTVRMQGILPSSITVPGWKTPFRVVSAEMQPNGGTVFLGLLDSSAVTLLKSLSFRFFLGWMSMVGFGFVVAFLGLERTLNRVDAITGAAASIRSEDLSSRVSAGNQNDEITRLANTFNNMLDRVSASVNQLRTVTDSVAHDLKSPVTSIRGSLEFALSTDDVEVSRELVAKAIENLDRLSEVITTSLDVAEAEAGALRLRTEPVDLAELVGRIAELYAPAFADRKQDFQPRLDRIVVAKVDLRLLTRMLSNLMENELRYAGEGAKIVVTVDEADGAARIQVTDDGPGFAPELLARVFQRFAKGAVSQGHGLGLAFVHSVAVAHGGVATASNRLPRGAEVTVKLPLTAFNAVTAQAAGTTQAAANAHV